MVKKTPRLTKPFFGNYPISLAFGEIPKNKKIRGKFVEWGIVGHNGIDYEMPEETPIVATDKGKVVMSGNYKDNYGILVKITHPWGESLYAHLEKITTKIRREVKRGQVIGFSGQTGFATKPHLHFAIRIKPFDRNDGYCGWSNPKPYLVKKFVSEKQFESESLIMAKKYLGKKVGVFIDRSLGSKHPKHGFVYKANYGYIPGTKAPDGEELDAYYLGVERPLKRGSGRCIAIVHRLDDDDDKLVVIPEGVELTDKEISKAVHFQEKWFKYEIVR